MCTVVGTVRLYALCVVFKVSQVWLLSLNLFSDLTYTALQTKYMSDATSSHDAA